MIVFGALYAADGSDPSALEAVAREFSPRIEVCVPPAGEPREITLDLRGLARLFGDTRTIAEELRRTAADRGLRVRIAIAGTRTAARLLVRHRAGITIVEPGTEAEAVAPLPLAVLAHLACLAEARAAAPERRRAEGRATPERRNDLPSTFRHWGLRTLGDIAALPAGDLAARLGPDGVHWQRIARGEDPQPLVPSVPEERFEQALDLEWPIEGLEPLSFVLGRLLEPLSAHLERRDRGAAVLHVRLRLVRTPGDTPAVHERTLQLPVAIRDARTLRTLALLDLESHPPPAAIDRVVVAVDPTPGRIVQFSLLTRPLPTPEQISTLTARLTALMGAGRCGSPAAVDAWTPGAFAMTPFAPQGAHDSEPRRHAGTEATIHSDRRVAAASFATGPALDAAAAGPGRIGQPEQPTGGALPVATVKDVRVAVAPWLAGMTDAATPAVALRRFRFPVPARVRVAHGRPERVTTDRRGLGGGRVEACAGPWRTSGAWWIGSAEGRADAASEAVTDGVGRAGHPPWDRDEWDVTLSDGGTYRLFRERDADHWFVEGIVD